MFQCVAQRSIGDFDEPVERTVHLQDEEDRGGHRAGAHEEHGEHCGIARREEAEADEENGEPADQDDEQRNRELVLRLLHQQPARLRHVAGDLLCLREQLALALGLRRQAAQQALKNYRAMRTQEGAIPTTCNRELGYLRTAMRTAAFTTPPMLSMTNIPKFPIVSEYEFARQGFTEDADFEKVVTTLPAYLVPLATVAYNSGIRDRK